MSKPAAKTKKFTRRFRRAPFIAVIAIAIVSLAAITVISRQRNAAKTPADNAAQKLSSAKTAAHVTNHAHSQDDQVTSPASEIKPLTAQEAEKLATELGPMLDQSTDIPQVRRGDGSVSMDLDGRFQNVTVARVNKDGTVSQSCVDNPRAAGRFFGIDPGMIQRAQTRRARINQN